MAAVGVLALAAIAACGPDEDDPTVDDALAACLPEAYRDSCVADLWTDFLQTCLDGRGSCTWTASQAGGLLDSRFEWANGASVESWAETAGGGGVTFQTASGKRCTLSQLDSRCWRFEAAERWYEYCSEVDESGPAPKYVATHYTCDDGSKATVRVDQLGTVSPMCMSYFLAPVASFDDCTDAAGRRYGDRTKAGIPPCKGEACGDIASYCSDTMPCDAGIVCTRLSADPAITVGYCTLPCEDQPCPTGTRCVQTLDRPSGKNIPLCHRECTMTAECEPYGRECIGVTDMRPGICG